MPNYTQIVVSLYLERLEFPSVTISIQFSTIHAKKDSNTHVPNTPNDSKKK